MADRPKIFVDVNIFVDIFEKRASQDGSYIVVNNVRKARLDGYISALTVPILYFRRIRVKPDKEARYDVRTMVKGFKIVGLNSAILLDAMKDRKFKDFEDVIQYYSAKIKTNTIISRNKVDFSSAEKKMNVLNPEEFLRKYTV